MCVSTRIFASQRRNKTFNVRRYCSVVPGEYFVAVNLTQKKKEPKLDVFVLDENGSKKRKTAFFLRTGKKGLKAVDKVTSSKISKLVAQTGIEQNLKILAF